MSGWKVLKIMKNATVGCAALLLEKAASGELKGAVKFASQVPAYVLLAVAASVGVFDNE